MNRIICILIFSVFFIQCEDDKHIPVANKNVSGKYIHLEPENIYLFVPKNINLFPKGKYEAYINAIEDEKLKRIERAKYLNLKYGSAGNFYIMQSDNKETDVTFKTIPHIEINQSVSQEILKYLNREHKALGEAIGLQSSFRKAGIIKKGNDRIFRSIFVYKGLGNEIAIYTYFYIVNRQGKSFVLSFNSQKHYDFDSYVQKIRL